MNRKLNFAVASLPLLMAGCAAQTEQKPMNVLFIAVDDMNDWSTLFDEENPIQTPNLKRLADRGCFFSQAYCAVPASNPSRTSILTGLYPTTTNVYGNKDDWKKLVPDQVTLPHHFMNNGYETKGGGKIFHHSLAAGGDRVDDPSFEEFYMLNKHANKPKLNYNGYRKESKVENLWKTSFDWGEHDVVKQTDEYTLDYIREVLANYDGERPLFLAPGIFRPHLPFWAPPKYFDMYPLDEVQMPPMPKDDFNDIPAKGVEMSDTEAFVYDNVARAPIGTVGSLQKMVQSYQAAATWSDHLIGELIDMLDESGLADNTIIVLWADHGYHLGDKESCVKFTLWEKATHVPFIVVAPGVTKAGSVCKSPVSLIDIYPTLIDLTNLPAVDNLEGESLVPLLKNPKRQLERPAIMTFGKGNHAIRDIRYRYISYEDGTEELYDSETDKWEWNNLAKDPKYADVIARLKKWVPQD